MNGGRLLWYLAVGGLSFVLDLAVLIILRREAQLPVWLATTGAYWTGFGVNFTLQRRLTFAARGPVASHMRRYCVVVAANYLGTVGIVDLANRTGIGYATGKVIAGALFAVLNYAAYNWWVFRDRELSHA